MFEIVMHELVKRVRDHYAPKFQGMCEGASADLSTMLEAYGIPHKMVEGRYMSPMTLDGDEYPYTPHFWIETNKLILDPTREQFDNSDLIINKGTPQARYYQATDVIKVR